MTNKKEPIYVLDDSAMKEVIEGKRDELLNKLIKTNLDFPDFKIVTSMSSFLRAMKLSSPNVIIKNIQSLMKLLDIRPDDVDYNNARAVKDRIVELAQLSEGI